LRELRYLDATGIFADIAAKRKSPVRWQLIILFLSDMEDIMG